MCVVCTDYRVQCTRLTWYVGVKCKLNIAIAHFRIRKRPLCAARVGGRRFDGALKNSWSRSTHCKKKKKPFVTLPSALGQQPQLQAACGVCTVGAEPPRNADTSRFEQVLPNRRSCGTKAVYYTYFKYNNN